MNLLNLREFFLDNRTAAEIREEINSEVETFRLRSAKIGSSNPIYVTDDNFHFTVTNENIKRLCNAYLDGEINQWHLIYICNSIELSTSFSIDNEKVEDAVFELSSPEINSPITPSLVKSICNDL